VSQLNRILDLQLGFKYQTEHPPYHKLDLLFSVGFVRVFLFKTSQLEKLSKRTIQKISFDKLSHVITSPDPTQEPVTQNYVLHSDAIQLAGLMEPARSTATALHQRLDDLVKTHKAEILNLTAQNVNLTQINHGHMKALNTSADKINNLNKAAERRDAEIKNFFEENQKLKAENQTLQTEQKKVLEANKQLTVALTERDAKWQKFFAKPYHLDKIASPEITRSEINLNDIVMRGPGWTDGNQDGGPGHFGVVSKSNKCGDHYHLSVRWLTEDASFMTSQDYRYEPNQNKPILTIVAKFNEIKKKIVPVTDLLLKQLKIGGRIKLKASLTSAEKDQTARVWSWDSAMDKYLGQWGVIHEIKSDGIRVTFACKTADTFTYCNSNFESAEIPADIKIKNQQLKALPMTETIFSQLKSGYRVKLKSKLTDVEKGQTTNRHGWDPEKDGMLGRWCAIVNFVGSESVSINADSGTDRHFHKSNLELAEMPVDTEIKQIPVTEAIYQKLKKGDRVKIKSKLTDAEIADTNKIMPNGDWVSKNAMLGGWYSIESMVTNGVRIQRHGDELTFHKSNLELVEIPADSQIKQVPITETIYQKLKKGDRVKLKSKLTEEEKKQTEKFYNAGWDSAKDKLLGNWVVINEIVTHGVKVQTESGAIWTFHKSNLNLAEITDPETDSDETIEETEQAKFEKVKAEFDSLVGRQSLKDHFLEFYAQTQINRKRLAAGLKVKAGASHHMIFKGKPGTGKTLLAKTFGRALFHLGVVKEDKFFNVGRDDLVGAYIGHTEAKTKATLEKAKGGVLFIDEAYALDPGTTSDNDFGKKAIESILLYMEEHRDEIVIIFAGYGQEMDHFLASNPGLESRIPYVFDFPDYTDKELLDIFKYELDSHGYEMTDPALKTKFVEFINQNQYNGREIRSIVERLIKVQAGRLSKMTKDDPTYELTRNDFITITQADLELVLGSYQPLRYDRHTVHKTRNRGSSFNLNLDPRLMEALFEMAKHHR